MNWKRVAVVIAVLLCVSFLTNIILLWTSGPKTDQPTEQKPPVVTLTAISCTDCFDVGQVVQQLSSNPVMSVKTSKILTQDSQDAKDAITKYGIKHLPALIITGEIDKLPAQIPKVKDALVIDSLSPPFFDLQNNTMRGKLSLKLIEPTNCPDCTKSATLVKELESLSITTKDVTTYQQDDAVVKDMIKKYNITALPSLILSSDIVYYPAFSQALLPNGQLIADSFVLDTVNPPYYDLNIYKVRGIISITYLNDSSCSNCYDVMLHKNALANAGMTFKTEKVVDVQSSEGKALAYKYNITLAPTIIISGDTSAYKAIINLWKSVGTVEKDGSLVFRKPEVVGTYKNLATQQVIVPSTTAQTQTQ